MPTEDALDWFTPLTNSNQELVRQIAAAISSQPITHDFGANDALFDGAFASAFGSYLKAWHFFNKHALSKKTFEYGLCHSFNSTGRVADIQKSATVAGHDVTIEGQSFSCKTETGCSSANKAVISKFFEARWIGNCDGDRNKIADELSRRFLSHTKSYSKILMLRAFDVEIGDVAAVSYTLHALDVSKFASAIQALKPDDFTLPRNSRGGCSARLVAEGLDIATVGIDASVEKITLNRINLDAFTRLFKWSISI